VSGEGRRCVKKGLLIWVGSWNKESKLVDRYKKFFWDSKKKKYKSPKDNFLRID
jgi:hypothetical protein